MLASGGDAPGMNAAVRAVARTAAFFEGWEVMGVNAGTGGCWRGGSTPWTGAGSAASCTGAGRCWGRSAPEMVRPEGQRRAAGNLEEAGVEGLVVIGGNGSLAGG